MGAYITVIIGISMFIAAIVGYILNLYKLITTITPLAEWTITEIIRFIGVLIPFIGAIVGYF